MDRKLSLCWFEVIDPNSAAKLYFDLEVKVSEYNSSNEIPTEKNIRDSVSMIVQKLLMKHQGYSETQALSAVSDVVFLTSSNDVKLSVHLIYPQIVFVNASHVSFML
jgi:hypothetical protein